MKHAITRPPDMLFASLGLTLGAPLLLLLTLIGWFDTRSPLFRQIRVGRNQQPFTLVKFCIHQALLALGE